ALASFALGPGDRALHAAGDAGFGADRDVRLHAALPESILAQLVGRVASAAHAILVDPHVAIGHRNGVDVRVHEFALPGQRVGDAVDVIPTASVETYEVFAEGGADLHQLKARFDLFDEHVNLDGAVGKAQVLFERRKDVVPKRCFLGGLDLGAVQHQRGAGFAQAPVIVADVEHRIDDGRGKTGAAGVPHVAVVQVQPARAKDLGREVELLFPVVDDGASEKTLRPLVHFARHLFGNFREHGIALDGQL